MGGGCHFIDRVNGEIGVSNKAVGGLDGTANMQENHQPIVTLPLLTCKHPLCGGSSTCFKNMLTGFGMDNR